VRDVQDTNLCDYSLQVFYIFHSEKRKR